MLLQTGKRLFFYENLKFLKAVEYSDGRKFMSNYENFDKNIENVDPLLFVAIFDLRKF